MDTKKENEKFEEKNTTGMYIIVVLSILLIVGMVAKAYVEHH